jgi:hypothetical protein
MATLPRIYQWKAKCHHLHVRLSTPGLIFAAGFLTAVVCYAGNRPTASILWIDSDMKNIPEPKERPNGWYDYFFKGQVLEHGKQKLDFPRWVRHAARRPKQASNVNALDEVPDSSWFTNRHHLHPMTIEQLVRGPDRGGQPDFKDATVVKAKTAGVSPGFWLKDRTGQSYVIKLDNVEYPGNESSAEVIATKIFYAAGYNVPENYVAYIDANQIHIGEKAQIQDNAGKKLALTQEDLNKILEKAAKMPDGRYRVLASKLIKGKPKGPFAHVGLREDDPNDLIPHEHRRELRGLRVIASWIGNWDLKEGQSLDMYVEEDGRKFLRHYLLDFNSALGADTDPTEYYHGHEYGLDLHGVVKEIFTLGAYRSPEEKQPALISTEVGLFTADDFDPGGWKQTFPSVMFDNLTPQDAFWATRIVLSFTEPEIRAMVETGQYLDPKDSDYIVKTLLERRRILARYWLMKVDGLADFSLKPAQNGVALEFQDLMVDHRLIDPTWVEYTYEITGPHYKSGRKITHEHRMTLSRAELAAAIEHGAVDEPIEIKIWTKRQNSTSLPVTIAFQWSPSRGACHIQRVSRG